MRVGKLLEFSGMGKTGAVAAGAFFGYRGAKGIYNEVAPNAINNMMDVAFDDPEADRAVLGTDLTPSMLYMGSGLPGARIARARNLSRTGINTGPVGAAVPPLLGATLGAATGGIIGKKYGLGSVGAAVGGLIGGAAGAAVTADNVLGTAARNRQVINQSPFYNQSLLTAERLNASGNIVLGMHNQRRG